MRTEKEVKAYRDRMQQSLDTLRAKNKQKNQQRILRAKIRVCNWFLEEVNE